MGGKEGAEEKLNKNTIKDKKIEVDMDNSTHGVLGISVMSKD